jgi:hydroxymethylglutaryl-CoA lyase
MSRPALPARVRVVEVSPRDGLQNEAAHVDTAAKVALVEALAGAGLPVIEVGAFVSPRWVPQMADTADLFRAIRPRESVVYTALVPNGKGLQLAIECGVTEISVFAAASETFSQRNINQTVEQSLQAYAIVARQALAAGMRVRAYLSTAFGCPYEGAVPVARVAELTARLRDMGAYEVAISDTIGIAHPGQVWDVLDVVTARTPLSAIALHLHDTRGTALANVLAGLHAGVTTFDSSAGGLGGCPYAPGAAGNLATEDLIYLLDGLRISTGVKLEAVLEASALIEPQLGHSLPSRYVQAIRSGRPSTARHDVRG